MDKYNQLLGDLLHTQGLPVMEENPYSLTRAKLRQNKYDALVQRVFKDLEGITGQYPVVLPGKCLSINGVMLHFDDMLHFNRYRKITLRSSFYDHCNFFSPQNYRRYCRNYEKECLKAGSGPGFWTDKTSEHYFGEPGNPGEFLDNGAPKWKLIGFNDFLLDVYFALHNQSFIRVAFYDPVMIDGALIPLGRILKLREKKYIPPLVNYFSRLLNIP